MSRPLDRTCTLPELGKVDRELGEFWVANPFMMPQAGENLSAYERNRLYLNAREKGFLDASYFSAVDIDSDSRSVVAADFDRDGRQDLLVANVGGGPLRLFLNRMSTQNRFVRLSLQGSDSNRSAVGARCEITCGSLRVVRDVFNANGCMGQAPAELLVGLGNCEQIDRLVVRWPTGATTTHANLPVDVTLEIREADSSVEVFHRRIGP